MLLSGLTHSLPWGRPQVSGNCLSTVTGLGQSWLWGRFRGLQICQPPGTRCGTLQSPTPPPQPYEEEKFSGQPPRHPSRPDSGCPFPLPDTRGRLHVPALLRPSLGSTRPGPPGIGTPGEQTSAIDLGSPSLSQGLAHGGRSANGRGRGRCCASSPTRLLFVRLLLTGSAKPRPGARTSPHSRFLGVLGSVWSQPPRSLQRA